MSTDLHETDSFAWTREQAARLRHLAGDNRIDAPNLAEEIEDLGKSELRAAERHVERNLEQFLKIEDSGQLDPINHWKAEIDIFRLGLDERLTASIKTRIAGSWDRRYELARRQLLSASDLFAGRSDYLPLNCPYEINRVLDPTWFPEPKQPRA